MRSLTIIATLLTLSACDPAQFDVPEPPAPQVGAEPCPEPQPCPAGMILGQGPHRCEWGCYEPTPDRPPCPDAPTCPAGTHLAIGAHRCDWTCAEGDL